MEDRIKAFLSVDCGYGGGYGDGSGYGDSNGYGDSYGYGNGDGSGNGYGRGNGYGSGNGDGNGYGDGYGYGDSNGYGDGYGNGKDIIEFNGNTVYQVDDVPTIIIHVNSSCTTAKGFILNNDFTMDSCFIVKQNNLFAHGDTLHEARAALEEKLFDYMDTDERIGLFVNEFDKDKAYPAQKYFDWHNKLTGSCLMGREAFIKNHNVDMDREYTVKEFIEICEDDYGGDIIKKLKEHYT